MKRPIQRGAESSSVLQASSTSARYYHFQLAYVAAKFRQVFGMPAFVFSFAKVQPARNIVVSPRKLFVRHMLCIIYLLGHPNIEKIYGNMVYS